MVVKTRKLSELLQLVIDNLKTFKNKQGLCLEVDWLEYHRVITPEEKHRLERFLLIEKKPQIFKDGRPYWWPRMSKGVQYREVRIKFVKSLLEEQLIFEENEHTK